jgi:hypothetical protein
LKKGKRYKESYFKRIDRDKLSPSKNYDHEQHTDILEGSKKRLLDEGNETVTNCNALKMLAVDGKMRLTDLADIPGAHLQLSKAISFGEAE